MLDEIYIYGLFDPRDLQPFYFGKANDLIGRACSGWNRATTDRIQQLEALGYKLRDIQVVVDIVANDPTRNLKLDDWVLVERAHICYAREVLNLQLTNGNDGGGGVTEQSELAKWHLSNVMRDKIAQGDFFAETHCAKIRQAKLGQSPSEATRNQIAQKVSDLHSSGHYAEANRKKRGRIPYNRGLTMKPTSDSTRELLKAKSLAYWQKVKSGEIVRGGR
jgi:hypothetical protein